MAKIKGKISGIICKRLHLQKENEIISDLMDGSYTFDEIVNRNKTSPNTVSKIKKYLDENPNHGFRIIEPTNNAIDSAINTIDSPQITIDSEDHYSPEKYENPESDEEIISDLSEELDDELTNYESPDIPKGYYISTGRAREDSLPGQSIISTTSGSFKIAEVYGVPIQKVEELLKRSGKLISGVHRWLSSRGKAKDRMHEGTSSSILREDFEDLLEDLKEIKEYVKLEKQRRKEL